MATAEELTRYHRHRREIFQRWQTSQLRPMTKDPVLPDKDVHPFVTFSLFILVLIAGGWFV